MQESYEKRFNLLINGIEETNTSVWEKRETILQLVQDFMKRGLQIKDPSAIMLADCHRLPQHPLLKNGIKVNRPIIIKLTNSNEKRLIFGSLKNLKQFNNVRKLNKQNFVFIIEHLPKQFQLERKGPFPLRAWKKAFFVCFIDFFCTRFYFNRSLQSKINKRDKECSFPRS